MQRDLKLPTFDYRVQPTMKSEWRKLADGHRPFSWWWHVAYVIRAKSVRHADEEKIKRVMCLVDSKLPHLMKDYVNGTSNSSRSDLPSYERISRGTLGAYIGTSRRG